MDNLNFTKKQSMEKIHKEELLLAYSGYSSISLMLSDLVVVENKFPCDGSLLSISLLN